MADIIFVGQTALTIRLDTKIDLTTAVSAQIKYINPNKETGIWTAVVDSPATSGTISYDIQSASDIGVAGDWKIWAFITFTGNTVAPGCIKEFTAINEGSDCG